MDQKLTIFCNFFFTKNIKLTIKEEKNVVLTKIDHLCNFFLKFTKKDNYKNRVRFRKASIMGPHDQGFSGYCMLSSVQLLWSRNPKRVPKDFKICQ